MLLNKTNDPLTIIIKMQAVAHYKYPVGTFLLFLCFAMALTSENFTNKYPVALLVDNNLLNIQLYLGFFFHSYKIILLH